MPVITRTLVLSSVAAACTACHSPLHPSTTPEIAVAVRVSHFGRLREIFHEQDTSSKITLDELTPDPTLYAIGALSELRGEITISAGQVFITYAITANSSETEVSTHSSERATLLVASQVASWREVPIVDPIAPGSFDERIESLASTAGVSTDDPFPFLIVGPTANLRWHVIDGRRLPAGSSSHADHLRAGVQHARDRTNASLVGFFSHRHQGVFTHRGSRTHVHCVLDSPRSSGHVDEVTVLPGTTLFLPTLLKSAGEPIAPAGSPPVAQVTRLCSSFPER
jgi:acetolactate decarboxylase